MNKQLFSRLYYILFLCIICETAFGYTLTLKPGPAAGKDAYLDSRTSSSNYANHTELAGTAWTCGFNPCNARGIFQFDLSSIPIGVNVINARLSLYANTVAENGNGIAMQGGNEAVLRRVTSSWAENTVTWNNVPSTTTLNEVTLQQSSTAFQNYLNIDVKNIVQDMVNNPTTSFGFLLKLVNEVPYSSMIFATSDFPNSSLWPEITIEYYFPITILPLNQLTYCAGSSVNVHFNGGGNNFNPNNIFTAQLSDVNGSFFNAINIGSLSATGSGVINATVPANINYGNGYRIRVISSSPAIISSDNGVNFSIPNPDDGNVCTSDVCNIANGFVVHSPILVDDNSVCTTDGCHSVTGVFHTPVNKDDQNPCTIDLCDANVGIIHFPVIINDYNACTIDACNTANGNITHTNILVDDGNPCTEDGCNSITGVYHQLYNTDDSNACTTDGCNSQTGIIFHIPVPTDDNNLCTTDGCNSLSGVFHITVDTDDNNACTFDICGAQTGVLHFPFITDDNNLCTQDACNTLTGDITHEAINIDDDNACTIDLCFPNSGIFHLSYNTDDGNACTLDGCNTITGVFNTPYNIDDNNNCTIDQCDTGTGTIYHIDDSPVVAASADAIICYGGNTCISVAASAGTPPYFGEGTFCGYTAGSYTFYITDSKGCEASSSSVTINEPAKLAVVTSTFPSGCLTNNGSANALAAGGIPPYSFIWTPGQQTGNSITGLAPGNYMVTLTDDNGCTSSAQAIVGSTAGNILAPQSISGPAAVCAKQNGVVYCIDNPDPSASSFNWSLPAGASLTNASNTCVTVKFSSRFKGGFICVNAVYPCGTSTSTCMNLILVTKKPFTPGGISGPVSVCPNQTATFTITPIPEASGYLWDEDHLTILSGQGTSTVVVKADAGFNNGKIKVRAVNCKGVSGERKLNLSLSSACRLSASLTKDKSINQELTVYPNPANDHIKVSFNSTVKEKSIISIIDITGKTVYSEIVSGADEFLTLELNLSSLSKGIYLLSVQNELTNKSVRLILN